MLKTSWKQERRRRFLSHTNYPFQLNNLVKPFLIKHVLQLVNLYWSTFYISSLNQYSRTKIQTICFLTGRSRSVYRFFKLSRLSVRTYSKCGYFIGLSKANW